MMVGEGGRRVVVAMNDGGSGVVVVFAKTPLILPLFRTPSTTTVNTIYHCHHRQ
ncbi:hypothetical protein HanIR_Chr01g0043521 [Helianthus annuus]|nr:hypothetical protein HanIR_Chr01g0043521 [Helianthus annuus]